MEPENKAVLFEFQRTIFSLCYYEDLECHWHSVTLIKSSRSYILGWKTPYLSLIPGGIDTTQNWTWASELFVVNRNGQDSFMTGFNVNTDIHLRGVEVTYLDCTCQIWGSGTSAINDC